MFRKLNFFDFIFPRGTKRRMAVRQPRKFISLYKNSLFAGKNKYLPLIEKPSKGEKTMEAFPLLHIPCSASPLVSIIIPAYNEFSYTYLCIKSILKHSGELPFEIIVADDCSTDLTTKIELVCDGLSVVRSKENLGFLKNCNQAAKTAKGQYILFLNNDTQVQPNWLKPLVSLIASSSDIGLVGSKLLYPNGRLQEAGGVIWSDGSGWNYGYSSKKPEAPQFNYVKEVDYISGAAMMIRRSLWEQIGGFDQRFAPAYAEDADLAFEVRKLGYRVLYQPQSQVVHFEGISNGTDLNQGLKAYQLINQKKFYEKWKKVLSQEHYPRHTRAFRARERSGKKSIALFIDHHIPHFDQDAGSRTIHQYLRLLIDMGFQIKFIGDDFEAHQPYADILQQMGVEILYGFWYQRSWRDWVKANGAEVDIVFLNRPHVAEQYIDYIKQVSSAKIIYNLCDLHFIRLQREYELTGNKELLRSSTVMKDKELNLIQKADIAFTVSADEKKILDNLFPNDKSTVCPIFIYDSFTETLEPRTAAKDLLFVGGFTHTPNVDAMQWFCREIFPLIVRQQGQVKLHIVGSKPPPAIEQLASEQIIVHGFVSDEQLIRFYADCGVCVVPLRFGAGVKGKVIEAMYYGIPIVSTSIGLEGLADIERYIIPYDDAEAFAQRVISLINQSDETQRLALYNYVKLHYSRPAAQDFFKRHFVKKSL